MKVTYEPGQYRCISISAGDKGRPTTLTVEGALEFYAKLGRAILDAINDKAQEARL